MDRCMDFSDDSGICTSILLETIILWKQMGPIQALRTAVGMSLISMILMELAMNLTDFAIMGRTCHHLVRITFYPWCWILGGMALQLLEIKKIWKVLSLDVK